MMSGLLNEAPEPRAVVLALHGGGVSSAYFDCPGRPDLSLLRMGPSLGFTVVALDRPGYGASHPRADLFGNPAVRVRHTYAALDALLKGRDGGTGVFLAAHSAGCELAVRMAAEQRGRRLLGLEIAGTGTEHSPALARRVASFARGPQKPSEPRAGAQNGRRSGPRWPGNRASLWGPASLYPPDVWDGAHRLTARSPSYESTGPTWASGEFARVAPGVRVPVRVTVAEHEAVWRSDPAAAEAMTGLFDGSPWAHADHQKASGHNLSIGRVARAYHLKLLAFVEECVVRRERGGRALI